MRIDLHTHSLVSDGTDTPTELVRKAAASGLDVLALTDHDTFDGLVEARLEARRAGITLLGGVEISAQRRGASVHLLGYGCDPHDAPLLEELARIRAGRTQRVPAMVARLNALGMEVTIDDVLARARGASLGRPHVADVLVERGYAATRDEVFARWLGEGGPAYVDRYATDLPAAIELVHRAGGVAVIAHPWARGRRGDLDEVYLAELVDGYGLDGVELDHPDHDADTRRELAAVAERLGVFTTGSSDYHGLGKSANPLGVETTRPEVFAEVVRRIRARGGTA